MSSNSKTKENENKRKRLTQACELCRRKKIKCDGEKPTCGNCTRLNNMCTYSSNSKKRGPRQGYIEMLEQRLAKMEQILLPEAAEKLGKDSSNSTLGENRMELEVNHSSSSYKESTEIELPPPPQLHSVTPSLSNLSNSKDSSSTFPRKNKRNRRSADDINSPTSYSSISSNFPSPPAPMMNGQQHIPLKVDYSQELLPPLNVIEHIIDLFFKFLYSSIPILDEATLRNDIKERKCPDFLILCLMAACARFSDRLDIKENPAWHAGESYAEKARAMILKVVDDPNIPNLQGILLLSLHEYGCGRGPRSWMYTGIVIRMAMELRLHKDLEDSVTLKNDQNFERLTKLEIRRGLFWSIFAMDKFSSAATGRPSSLPEKFCTTFLPVVEYNDDQYYTENLDGNRFVMLNVDGLKNTELIGANDFRGHNIDVLERRPYLNCFAYFIRTTNLLSKVTAYINLKHEEDNLLPYNPDSEFYKLDHAIDDLYSQLPPHLKNTRENLDNCTRCNQKGKKTNFIILHILYNTVVVILHRPSLVIVETIDNKAVHPELKEFVYCSVKKCMDAVDNVTVLLQEIGKDKEMMPPFLSYLTYTVATVVVDASFSPRPEEAQKAKQALGIYFQLLLTARSLWAMADKLYFMVRDFYAIQTNALRKKLENQVNNFEQRQQTNPEQFSFELLQQQQCQPFQQFEQPSQPYQQFPLQQVTTSNDDSSAINSSMVDWALSYYNTAMSYEAPMTGSTNLVLNSDGNLPLNNFQVPNDDPNRNSIFNSDSLT